MTWTGLQELKTALRNLPRDLAQDARGIVTAAADGAKADAAAAYPDRTGALKGGLGLRPVASGPFGTVIRLVNRSPHAALFENGTQARHTALGANRGAMPPGHVFVPAVVRRRRLMYQDLIRMLESHGLTVSGRA